jgi:dienelactone hydrolase
LATALAWAAQPGAAVADAEPPGMPAATVEPFVQEGAVRGVLALPKVSTRGAVLILHDASGHDGRANSYADQLLAAGLAVLEIFEHDDDAPAVDAAAAALANRVGPSRVGVLSFGAGAGIAVGLHAVTARALLYPGCTEHLGQRLAAAAGPVLLAHGGHDPVNPTGACAAVAASLGASGRPVRHLVYEHAGYAWDYRAIGQEARSFIPHPGGRGHVEARAWPELRAMSAAEVAGFLATSLAP